jgi:O-antigen ligase
MYLFIFVAYFYCRAATAILVVAILLTSLILYRIGWLKGLDYKWTLFICIISFAVIISTQSSSSFDWIFALLGKDSLLGGRLRIWNAAFNGWLDNFWLGIGVDSNVTSTILYQHGFVTAGWGNYVGHAHNIFFEILLKSGLIGIICFIGQLLLCYKGMMLNRKSRIAQFLCVMFLLFWITSMLDYRIEQIVGWILIMLLYDIELLDSSVRGIGDE